MIYQMPIAQPGPLFHLVILRLLVLCCFVYECLYLCLTLSLRNWSRMQKMLEQKKFDFYSTRTLMDRTQGFFTILNLPRSRFIDCSTSRSKPFLQYNKKFTNAVEVWAFQMDAWLVVFFSLIFSQFFPAAYFPVLSSAFCQSAFLFVLLGSGSLRLQWWNIFWRGLEGGSDAIPERQTEGSV